MKKRSLIVYTIGHSNRSIGEFINILSKFGIEQVVDVRRFPTSKKFPYFNMENLKETLKKNGIHYIYLGNELGGFRSGGYEEYMKTVDYRKGVKKLLQLCKLRTTAIMCSEKLWFKCHRRFIAKSLLRKNVEIIHIIDDEKTYKQLS